MTPRMLQVLLLSRRDPRGEWNIRNRHGIFRVGDERSIKTAMEAARARIPGWENCEPFTEFKVTVETYL